MSIDFELLAEGTALHIVLNESTHTWPPVVGAECVISFQFAWVACSGNVIVLCHYFMSDVNVFWYVAFITIKKNRLIIDMLNRPVKEVSLGFCWTISL